MKLTPTKIARAMELKPFQTDGRLVLDTRGIHHTVKPFRNFAHATEIHAAEKNLASAEGLFIAEKLAASGIIQPHMEVLSHEAVLQSFRATGGKQAAHAIPCQVVIDSKFPHQFKNAQGKLLNNTYLHRVIQLFARCTWAPTLINAMDSKLDYNEDSAFVEMYRMAMQDVCKGNAAYDVFREYNWKKEQILRGVYERVEDTSLTREDIEIFADALTREHGTSAAGQAKVSEILDDRKALSEMNHQRLIVVEKYFDASKIIPHEVHSGQMKHTIEQENWGDKTASGSAA